MTDHPPPLEILAGQETARVDDGEEGHIERIAEADETSPFLTGRDVDAAGHRLGLVGDNAHRMTTDRCETDDKIRRPLGPELVEDTVVDDGCDHRADVVGTGRGGRQQLPRLGDRPTGRVVGRDRRRHLIHVIRQVGEDLEQVVLGLIQLLDDRGRQSTAALVRTGAAQVETAHISAGEIAHHLRSGKIGVGISGEHHHVGQSEKERRTRQHGTIGDEEKRHDPAASDHLTGDATPGDRWGQPLGHPDTGGGDVGDHGEPLLPGSPQPRLGDEAVRLRSACRRDGTPGAQS